jgi:hypothetical protein
LKTNKTILVKFLGRKMLVIALITSTAIAGFAALGDGKTASTSDRPLRSLLTNKSQTNSFTLRSGFKFRGNQVINTNTQKYVNLNMVLTYQKGNMTYVLPLKKKVLDNVKIDFSNRQLRRN